MNYHEKILELKKENRSFVTITVVQTTGSTPGKTGFKMIVDKDKNIWGTVGGGALEKEAVNESHKLMASSRGSMLKEYLLSNDENIIETEASVIPMTCSGRIWLYYEAEQNLTPVYIFGGGHVGQALIDILKNMSYYIILVDNRQEILEMCKSKGVYSVLADYNEYVEKFIPQENSLFVVMTYGHQFDYEIVRALYKRNLVKKYAGVIASSAKAAGIIKSLKSELGDNIDLSKLHTPIGLMIGGDTAYEIALSVAAQLQAIRYEKMV